MKNKFFVEYEFKTYLDNYYWFPLIINAEDLNSAQTVAQTVEEAIKQDYDLIRKSRVQQIFEKINAEFISDYLKQRERGELVALKLDVWRFENVPTNPEMNYDEHMEMALLGDIFSNKSIVKTVARYEIPVRLYYCKQKLDFKEFLNLKVVDPDNVNDLYIVVEISNEVYSSSRLSQLNEGIWKDAHLKGYKVRVDAPHTPDGKRHIHIANSKHIHSKNKQVSWNDDLTRHDKKSFDQNFHGIEKAKKIAIKALGLDNNSILENIIIEDVLLTENIQPNQKRYKIFFLSLK